MASDVLHKLSAYRLEIDRIDTLAFQGFREVDADTSTIDKQEFEYRLFFNKRVQKNASWYPAFSHLQLQNKDIPKTMNAGFILLVKLPNACYAVTGGVGYLQLRKTVEVTYQFGIELAKRILSEQELRSLAQRDTGGNVNAIDRHFRGRYRPQSDVNNLRRILKNIRGQLSKTRNPLIKRIGSSIQGTDALSVNGSKSFNDILRFLTATEELWQNGKDRIIIPSLEQLDKKAHADLVAELQNALIGNLVAYDADDPQLLFIEGEERNVFDDTTVKWTLHTNKWTQEASSVSDLFSYVRDRLNQFAPGQDRLNAFAALELRIEYDDGVEEDGPLFRFLCGDIVHKNENYFLDHRSWYHASDAYLKALTSQLDNIECIDPAELGLNEWDKDIYDDEDAFNSSHTDFILLDKRLVKLDDETGIEFCDLFGRSGARHCLIHVKQANGAELRALFAQGSVSGTLYSEVDAFKHIVHAADFSFREGIAALTKEQKAMLADLKNKQIRELTVVYAIFDTTPSHTVAPKAEHTSQLFAGTLSTFAKVDLLNHCQALRGMGYGVALTRIRPYPIAVTKPKKSKAA